MYKVVIPSAGIGSRIGTYTKFMNKALVSIDNLPAICHIIDNFPGAEEIIVLTGYCADHLEQVLRAFYPGDRVKTIRVANYNDEGSGLGHTLSCAEAELQCPFIFVSNDTLVLHENIDLDPNKHGNWMGYISSKDRETSQYRTLECEYGIVKSINPKGVHSDFVYIGLAGIKDYAAFWKTMNGGGGDQISVGESYGLKGVSDISAVHVPSWCDIGNLRALEQTREAFSAKDTEYNILEKDNEAIWFRDALVYKFSTDRNFIRDRVSRRVQLSDELFPKIVYSDENLYVYKRAEGTVLSKVFTPNRMQAILSQIQSHLWADASTANKNLLQPDCMAFYRDKTYERVRAYLKKYEVLDAPAVINDESVRSVMDSLDVVDWNTLAEGAVLRSFHGDFHNENILIDENSKVTLLDWRQNFAGDLHTGDVYYDLAKFYHGLYVSHDIVNKNGFTVTDSGNENYHISILRPSELVDGESAFIRWLYSHGYSVGRVQLLTALIFINIATLHEWPYSKYLYLLGRSLLEKFTKNNILEG